MPRPKPYPLEEGFVPWRQVAKEAGCSVLTARRTYARALAKIRAALEAGGIDVAFVKAYYHAIDADRGMQYDNLAMLMPASRPYAADPDSDVAHRSLHD